MIRTRPDFLSCTITSVTDSGIAQIERAPFKKALFPISALIFYEHGGELYYPHSLEFRLIDNNILYLIEELKIGGVREMIKVLESSMEKEEKWSNVFEIYCVHLKNKPRHMQRITTDFKLDYVTKDIYE